MSKEEKILEEQKPNLELFETYVAEKKYEASYKELMKILKKLDSNYGGIQDIEFRIPLQLVNSLLEDRKIILFCTRMAVTITNLFSDPEFNLSESGAENLIIFQRWIAMIFGSSPYLNTDHILKVYNRNPNKNSKELHLDFTKAAFLKFAVMYLPDSNYDISWEKLWEIDKKLCATLCMILETSRFIGTDEAFTKRGEILQWLPEKLMELDDLDGLPSELLHDVYMHCSYDVAANKHYVKKALNKLIRNHLLKNGWKDRDVSEIGYKDGKPVVIVLLEHFHNAHSIYRTHSTSMLAAKDKFYFIGIGNKDVDKAGREVFNEFYELKTQNIMAQLLEVKKICDENKAAILYMPSIGMFLTTIFASNARFAPIQVIALGHPATTHSDFIEYVVVEDDYVGSEDCFSEELLRLPKDALPYVPSALAPQKVEYILRENPEVVQIGIASTTMKLNPFFLRALREIKDRAKVKIHFHFALGQSSGVTHPHVERFIQGYLGDSATAHPHAPYDKYLSILHQCDMLVNPFPFGNTNGIIDMVTLGLVGICKTGPEVHEHIDEGLFKRMELPEWLIANTVDEYVEKAVRLAENHKERLEIRKYIIENNGLKTLFTGDPSPMGKIFMEKLKNWAKENNVEIRV